MHVVPNAQLSRKQTGPIRRSDTTLERPRHFDLIDCPLPSSTLSPNASIPIGMIRSTVGGHIHHACHESLLTLRWCCASCRSCRPCPPPLPRAPRHHTTPLSACITPSLCSSSSERARAINTWCVGGGGAHRAGLGLLAPAACDVGGQCPDVLETCPAPAVTRCDRQRQSEAARGAERERGREGGGADWRWRRRRSRASSPQGSSTP
eukprot:3344104-Rhodomonas_salina.1